MFRGRERLIIQPLPPLYHFRLEEGLHGHFPFSLVVAVLHEAKVFAIWSDSCRGVEFAILQTFMFESARTVATWLGIVFHVYSPGFPDLSGGGEKDKSSAILPCLQSGKKIPLLLERRNVRKTNNASLARAAKIEINGLCLD